MKPCSLYRIITRANQLHNGILTVLIKLKIIVCNFKMQHLMHNIIAEQVMYKPGHGPRLCKLVKRKKKLIALALWNSGAIVFDLHHTGASG
jgi:hypothetical protein